MTALNTFPPAVQTELVLAANDFKAGLHAKVISRMAPVCAVYPQCGLAHKLHGSALDLLGQSAEAVAALRAAVSLLPEDAQAWSNLGNALQHAHEWAAALQAHQQAITLQPGQAVFRYNLGCCYLEQGDKLAALEQFWRAYELDPADGELAQLCRVLVLEVGDPQLQQAFCRLNLRHQPDDHGAQAMLGALLLNAREGDLTEAEHLLRAALAADPSQATVWSNLAILLERQHRMFEALQAGEHAVAADPEWAMGHNNLGVTLRAMAQWADARACFERALTLDPECADAWYNLGCVCIDLGDHEMARAASIEAVQRRAEPAWLLQGAHACRQVVDWESAAILEAALQEQLQQPDWGGTPVSPFAYLAVPGTTAAQQLQLAGGFAQQFAHLSALPRRPRSAVDAGSRALRVGLLSADFRDHATAHLLTGVLEATDPARVEWVAYDYSPEAAPGDVYRQRLQAAIPHWVDVRTLTDLEAAQRMQADELDIVIDLKGWTQGYRAGILVYRPVPVQMQWLGYPGTMGAFWIDYLIADGVVIPEGAEAGYSERILRLPGCYQPNDRHRSMSAPPSRCALGLPDDAVVLAAFHQFYKITDAMFAMWLRVLQQRPNTVLWLLEGADAGKQALMQLARQAGVAERLVWAPRVAPAENLGRLAQADLALDTFPVNAHTTASDALWAGVPQLARCGATFVSRVSASIVSAAGLPELVCGSDAEYEDLLLTLVDDSTRRQQLRERVRAARTGSPLFDSVAFARALERLLWQAHAAAQVSAHG